MSTVVCQGLQSCLESQLAETRTTLRLKLASPTKPSHNEETNHNNSSNLDMGGWSFLQSLSNTSQNPSQNPKQALERESFYVHPMEKRSLSTLSDKSLELCTENLGSETGTDMIETSIFSFHKMDTMLSVHKNDSQGGDKPKPRLLQGMENSGKANNCGDFPPPLTTMTGSSSIQVRPHREGGRLIIQAIEAPTNYSYLQAERSHGRLRLSFWRDCCDTTFDSEMGCEENEEESDMEEVENEEEEQDFEEKEEGFEKEKEEEEEEEEEEEDDDDDDDDDEREDMEGNSLEVEVEMGMEKFQRPSRCKEGGHGNNGLCNWETFWVATS